MNSYTLYKHVTKGYMYGLHYFMSKYLKYYSQFPYIIILLLPQNIVITRILVFHNVHIIIMVYTLWNNIIIVVVSLFYYFFFDYRICNYQLSDKMIIFCTTIFIALSNVKCVYIIHILRIIISNGNSFIVLYFIYIYYYFTTHNLQYEFFLFFFF